MKSNLIKFLVFIQLTIGTFPYSFANSSPAHFKIKSLAGFFPNEKVDKKTQEIDGIKIKKIDNYEDDGAFSIDRYLLQTSFGEITAFIQKNATSIQDFYVRLPQHFSHDLILKELHDTYGRHQEYIRKDQAALYTWTKSEKMTIIYLGACTITCFPIFLEFVTKNTNTTPLYNKFNKALPKP